MNQLIRARHSYLALLFFINVGVSFKEDEILKKSKYSFKQFCLDNNYLELLELWDYELNTKNPEEVGHSTSDKYWFKCPKGLHESSLFGVGNVVKGYTNKGSYCMCHRCNSIGQHIVEKYGEKYLNEIWSEKNIISPFDIERSSKKIVWLKCTNDSTHPDYDISANNFQKTHTCPYCIGKRLCKTNSFGHIFPKSKDIWSDKNDKTPFDYYHGSKEKVWFKCENGVHDDYIRPINQQFRLVYLCPVCGKENRIKSMPRGENSPYWKGDAVNENRRARDCFEYDNWRKLVFEKNDYVCQCCGIRGGRLNAHHIKDFANYKELRYVVDNGITLCSSCHDFTVKGSFHNTYGTRGTTPEQLEEYINSKRTELGITIPFSLESYLSGNILKPDDIQYDFNPKWIFEDENYRGKISAQEYIRIKY